MSIITALTCVGQMITYSPDGRVASSYEYMTTIIVNSAKTSMLMSSNEFKLTKTGATTYQFKKTGYGSGTIDFANGNLYYSRDFPPKQTELLSCSEE